LPFHFTNVQHLNTAHATTIWVLRKLEQHRLHQVFSIARVPK
jgi:hypothetical protein